MKTRKYFFVCAVTLLLSLSCFGNRQNTAVPELSQETKQSNAEEVMQHTLDKPLTLEEAKQLIYDHDEYITRRNLEILFMKKSNFGIPKGENWIIRLSNHYICIYAINNNGIEKKYYLVDDSYDGFGSFDVMQDILGTHLPNGTSSVGDFNDDGIDEIFQYGYGTTGAVIYIWGYDAEKDSFVTYHALPFRIIDPQNGPAPVEFMTYNGMYGFKAYYYEASVAGGRDSVYEPNLDNDKWFFYTWDEERREYVLVAEIIEE